MKSYLFYVLAAFAEIAGCYAFWAWLRLNKPIWVVLPGMLSLAAFAFFLTKVESDFAGRAYAAYGSIYILAALVWLWAVEGKLPDRWGRHGGDDMPYRRGGYPPRPTLAGRQGSILFSLALFFPGSFWKSG